MIRIVYVYLIFLSIINFSLEYEYFDDNLPDYGNADIKQQVMNLQAVQRSINKKNEDTSDRQYAESNIGNSTPQLKEDYKIVDNWPTPSKKLGAVSAVALDLYKNVVVFHRGDRVWNADTFDAQNNFRQRYLGPIKENTIITFDRDTGNVLNEWGKNLFFMPHGLHIYGSNYYITDVALHQVFRFNIKNSMTKPDLVLGDAFKPSMTSKTFCKPTSVAQLENGDFFVADGYCNARIIKFNSKGEKILEWGKNSFSGEISTGAEPPNSFAVPHALTLVPPKELLCVADRENGRIQCFNWSDGKFSSQYHSKIVGDRLFSVDYANNSLYVVNGPDARNKDIAGYIFDMDSGDVSGKFGKFLDPHDIAVTSDAREIYVGDLSADASGSRIHKYLLNGIKPTITREGDLINTVPSAKLPMRRGETALIVGSIVLLFAVFTVGIAILISKRKRRGKKIVGHLKFPWERADSKKLFYNEYNQFEKIPQNDDSTSENINEYA